MRAANCAPYCLFVRPRRLLTADPTGLRAWLMEPKQPKQATLRSLLSWECSAGALLV